MIPTADRVVSLAPSADSNGLAQRIPALLAEMDAEHREVLESVAALAIVPPAGFARAYAALVAQIEAGFREEEKMMDEMGYSDLRAHRRDHAELLALLHRLRPYLDDGNAPLADIVMGMIPAMLVRHMAGMDQALALALRVRATAAGPC
ncbi:bacteriohemerythrin [Herbaspirillum sp.]|jgi:hemerythrin|uniref:bacteriohemerythrin n=1 Tax=Herbaspirillum TaxID=963 RepID=UPI00258FECA1|nr:hemerythrin family protein [Herbaspirillum sp.]MCP3657696.1 hemerythrin family protein [Herbaspirillum sp.]MCP3949868.1 hemerythrin family protein [Herbaspirillum sp.]MCP4035119.1 hemerythrin family protein [Herbaspirillum sp.]MCP4556598.1 hemerythrin family protein [Herbaspirillum sp.]